ncbi:MAG TPA: DUF5723 family protein [Bacteroidales bacterium]|nr:DUF5723 family protein [Bacteroidales bacterium]HOG56395.1 DUF5723 family protein [Bacteroidales bacterium]HPV16956.1 DUF5723 family protein [Bacteroidales bacterium]HPX43344.1 DUF5723 family protein [Bacteroidales bacterium]HQB85882.1 DUF5723 family protein [Bacteroidales bacterium]
METKIILSAVFILFAAGAASQNSQVLYFMDLPQNHLVNPAFRPSNRVYVGLPGLTGVNASLKNNMFNFSDLLFEKGETNDSEVPFLNKDFDTEGFMSRLKSINYFEPEGTVQLLGIGISPDKYNDLYIFLDVNEHVSAGALLPRDFFRLTFEGNQDLAGQSFDLSDTRVNALYYREIGIGASKNINPRLRVGGKVRLLFGVASAGLSNKGLNLTVNNDYTNTLEADMSLDISGPLSVVADADGIIEDVVFDDRFNDAADVISFLGNTKNAGFGVDLGASFVVTDRLTVSASITDAGFIKWKSDVTSLKARGTIELSGLDLQDVYNETATVEDVAGSLIDSLRNAFVLANEVKQFITRLPAGLAVGGRYDLNDKFSLGLLSYTQISDKQIREAVTISGNMNISNILTTTLAYTACNHRYDNIGLGFGVRGSVFQFYFLCDKIPLSWKRSGDNDGEIFLPARWNTLHARVGMNLVFGNKTARSTYLLEQ